MASKLRNLFYDRKWLASYKSESVVISVGNLTWGGTGKTSLVSELCRYLSEQGCSIAIISRGYGRTSRGTLVVSDGHAVRATWREAGDEPYLLASRYPGVRVIVDADRSRALRMLEPQLPDVVLLDDAYQHRRVIRDLDLLLIDASEDVLNMRVLPFGKLREPVDSIDRAGAIILTNTDIAFPATLEWLAAGATVPLYHAGYVIRNADDVERRTVAAFCGLGAPRHFFRSLEACNASLVMKQTYRDHHAYSRSDLAALQQSARAAGAELLVTTAKDAVKIDSAWLTMPLIILRAEFRVEERQFYEQILRSVRDRSRKLKVEE